jgi:hypothetical protein
MLEWIVQPGHLGELDGAFEITGEPELLERGDVTEIPEHRAHQGIVLAMQIVVGEHADDRERPLPRLGQTGREAFPETIRGRKKSWRHPRLLTRRAWRTNY